jgi:hypothetical protein
MSTYTSLSTNSKTFWIKAADAEIGYLKYTGWLSWKADISLATGEIFKVASKGFFGTSIEVKQSEKIWASFSMDWKGHLLIQTYFDEFESQIYVFKQQSLFKNAYILNTAAGAEILTIQPDYQWSRFRYDHRIETNEDFERLPHTNLFLIIAVYCTNYLIMIQNASIGAGA